MADSKFNIQITAVDNATKTINNINKSIGSIFRPYDSAKRSAKSFFDAIGKNDLISRPIWGLQILGGAVGNFSSAFGVAENSVMAGSARIAASLGEIGGPVGAFIAGAVSVAGATTAVGVKMGKMGFDVARTAKNLNVTTDQLQEYRGAAQLAGLETQTMDASLGALGTTLQDAAVGRNLQAATLLSQMGISVKRTKDGAVDTVQALRDVSDVISQIKDQNVARKITDMLGVTELLPLLREGTTKLDEFIGTAHKVGLVMDKDLIDKNKEQADSWNKTKAAVEGMGTSLGNLIAQYSHLDDFANGVEKLADATKRWAGKNTEAKKKPGDEPPGVIKSSVAGLVLSGPVGAALGVGYGLITDYGRSVTKGSRSASGKVTEMGETPASPTAAADPGMYGNEGRLPRGIRNNNPGNLNYAGQAGASKEEGASGRFATFPTADAGLAALGKNLVAYQDKYKIDTISKIVNRWAPPSDNNNTSAYVASVSKQTGYGADQSLDLHDPKVLAPLISAITKHENGQNPYSADVIASAAAAAVRESQGATKDGGDRPITLVVQNVPAGMTVKAVRGLGQSTIGLAMAPGGAS